MARGEPLPGDLARRYDGAFFLGLAVWLLMLNLVGFAPSFYLRSNLEPLPLPVLVHGAVYTGWIVVFMLQASLMSWGQAWIHRRVGVLAAAWLLVMVPAGAWPVLHKAALGTKSVDEAGFNLTTLALGLVLAFSGLRYRNTPYLHKRLMLLATMVFSVAAADRVALLTGLQDVRMFRKVLAIVPALALIVYDLAIWKRASRLVLGVLTVFWLVIYVVVSDSLFLTAFGESIVRTLARPMMPATDGGG